MKHEKAGGKVFQAGRALKMESREGFTSLRNHQLLGKLCLNSWCAWYSSSVIRISKVKNPMCQFGGKGNTAEDGFVLG
jgi:hypothetical protein